MTISPAGLAALPGNPMVQNRLTVAHLLLWMATTGFLLARLQMHQPVGSATKESVNSRAEFTDEELKAGRRETVRRYIALIFAPVNGVAFAAVLLALWRVATRRFGFPTQPGHWLLILFGVLLAVSDVRNQLLSTIPRDGAEMLSAAVATCLLVIVAYVNRQRLRWSVAFAIPAVGFGTAFLVFLLRTLSPAIQPVNLMSLGLLVFTSFPLLLVVCTAFDLAERQRYDIFHWIGIATLLGCTVHFAALISLLRMAR